MNHLLDTACSNDAVANEHLRFTNNLLYAEKLINDISEYKGELCHYTSPDGLESILFKNESMCTLWASRYDCLNDMSEGCVAGEVYQEVCDELLEEGTINQDQFRFFESLHPEKEKGTFGVAADGFGYTPFDYENFIVSFSKNEDSLAMWNYYTKGNNYEGFNIKFESAQIVSCLNQPPNWLFTAEIHKVIYDREIQKQCVKEIILQFASDYEIHICSENKTCIARCFARLNAIFKRDCFKHEEEVRLIINMINDCDAPEQAPYAINYRYKNGYIIPYIQLEFKKEIVTGNTIGPLLITEEQKQLQKQILEHRLKRAGYKKPTVHISNIPVRY